MRSGRGGDAVRLLDQSSLTSRVINASDDQPVM